MNAKPVSDNDRTFLRILTGTLSQMVGAASNGALFVCLLNVGNALLENQLDDAVEDLRKFVAREKQRQNNSHNDMSMR